MWKHCRLNMSHKHHIIPKHMGGTDDPSNLVDVTIEEHAALHKQLWEDLGCWQDEIAWKALSGQIDRAQAIKEAQRQYMSNRVVSNETREKISTAKKGIKQSQETILKRRIKLVGQKRCFKNKDEWKSNLSKSKSGKYAGQNNPFYGRTHNEDTLEKNRQAHMGKTYNKGRIFEKINCEMCGCAVASNRLGFHQASKKCLTLSADSDKIKVC